MKEDWYRKAYGPSAAKTYETSLFNLITTEFGYIGGPDVVKLFAKKIVELNNQYYLRGEFVRPGQMRWLVLKAGQKYSKSKKLSDMQLIPVTLTVISPEDIEDRITKVKKNELVEKLIVRLCTETKEQGGVLTETDIAILLRVSCAMISNHVTSYEKRTKKVIPRAGTEMDMGKSLTHKRLVVNCYAIGVFKHLNVRRSRSVHFESVIPHSFAGVFLHSTPLSSSYFNPPCSLQKLKWVQ